MLINILTDDIQANEAFKFNAQFNVILKTLLTLQWPNLFILGVGHLFC